MIIFGFDNGSIDVYCLDINIDVKEVNLLRTQVLRPHISSIIHLAIEPIEETIFMSTSSDQTLFIYNFSQEGCDSQLKPLAFIPINTELRLITFNKHKDDAVIKWILSLLSILIFEVIKIFITGYL